MDIGLDCLEMFSPNWEDIGSFYGNWDSGSTLVSQSLVLNDDKDELVKATVGVNKRNVIPEKKTSAALKSHSEAERRRRQRINSHLDTLRGLVPYSEKMEKATLLAEVISQVKQLKKTALESSNGLVIPIDDDEFSVEPISQEDGSFLIKATLNCKYRAELLSEVRQTLNSLHLNIVNAEISTLKNRVGIKFILASKKDVIWANAEACQVIVKSVHQALSNILEKMSSAEYSPRTTLGNKRRRHMYFDSTSSSSLD